MLTLRPRYGFIRYPCTARGCAVHIQAESFRVKTASSILASQGRDAPHVARLPMQRPRRDCAQELACRALARLGRMCKRGRGRYGRGRGRLARQQAVLVHVLQARVADQLVVRDAQLSQLETRPKHRPEPIVRDTASHKFEAGQLVTIPARNDRVGTGGRRVASQKDGP